MKLPKDVPEPFLLMGLHEAVRGDGPKLTPEEATRAVDKSHDGFYCTVKGVLIQANLRGSTASPTIFDHRHGAGAFREGLKRAQELTNTITLEEVSA